MSRTNVTSTLFPFSATLTLFIPTFLEIDLPSTRPPLNWCSYVCMCGRANGELASIAADHFTMLRGTWFEVQGDKWYPFEEAEALSIEKKHCGPEMRDKVGIWREGKEGSLEDTQRE